jgi:signal transduction histidine kinase
MPGPYPDAVPTDWTSATTLESLQLLTDSITELVQFGAALINLVDGDDLVVTVVSGMDEAQAADGSRQTSAEIVGTRWPRTALDQILLEGEDLGAFFFLRQGETSGLDQIGWTTYREMLEHPQAWQPLDVLVAPLHDRDGRLIGALSIDDPVSGLRPNATTVRLLGQWADYANRVLLEALEREQLSLRARLLDRTRDVLSMLAEAEDPQSLLAETHDVIVTAFDADGVLIQTFRDYGWGAGSEFSTAAGRNVGHSEVIAAVEQLARQAWRQREVMEFSAENIARDHRLAPHLEPIMEWRRRNRVDRVLFAPIGAGREAMGSVMITRAPGRPEWTDLERDAARDLGHDIGRILRSARAYRREQQLARELQRLDGYKNDLIATVSHELKNPLSVIIGNAELIADNVHRRSAPQRRNVHAIQRAAQRMSRVVDDLLLLSRVADPDHSGDLLRVDLGEIAARVIALVEPIAAGRRQTMTLRATPPVDVLGEPPELERVVQALLTNAVKYTPEGGEIVVTVRGTPVGVELAVADTGIGIVEGDRERIFEEFYRAPAPAVLGQAGTGLGLAIVDRIVRRHGGTVGVESEPGAGSTFRVTLPAAPPAG